MKFALSCTGYAGSKNGSKTQASHERKEMCVIGNRLFEQVDIFCELWDQDQAEKRPHSHLYCLEPIAVGSPMVESLTSYLTRLAEAHSVFPRVLVAKEITPVVDPHLASRATYRSTGFWKQCPALNGVTSLAAGMVQALQQLTQRNDLRFLTMLPWKEVLADSRLVRRTRAWCPLCYEEWRVSHQEVYDPLLWALEDITHCLRHGVQLQQHCPNPDCGRMLYPLYSTAQPGYCTWCHQWLGQTLSFAQKGEEDWAWQVWINRAVGELLATAPTLFAFPSRENVAATLTVYEQMTTSRNAFARQL